MADTINRSDKINSSIARRLNTRLFYKNLGSFMALNLVICILFLVGTMVQVHKNMGVLVETYSSLSVEQRGENQVQALEVINSLGYEISVYENSAEGEWTTWNKEGWLTLDEGEAKFSDAVKTLKYHKTFEISQGESIEISATLGESAILFLWAMLALSIWELLVLLSGLGKNKRLIRRTLRPLEELSQAAKMLNNIAGTLDSINANQLDTRIPASLAKDELKILGEAINGMLDRIDAAYHSQMRFVSDASHELRTPISVIQGYASILDRWGKDDPDTMEESIQAIKSEANGMKEMVEQLLFLARGDNDSMHVEFEMLDLSHLFTTVFKEMEMIDNSHIFQLELNEQEQVFIRGDEGLIKQLLRILIDNSMKYTPENGKIKASLKTSFGKVLLSVQDEGRGISGETLPYIFDRFYRADESRTRKTGGTGLGLSIAKWIIGRHEGALEVVSRQGIGTRFTVTLPMLTDNSEV